MAVCGHVDAPRGDDAAVSQRQTNTVRSHVHVESERQNEQTDMAALTATERRAGAVRAERRSGWEKWVTGASCGMRNGTQTYCGEHCELHTNFKSLRFIPETDIMLYTDFT